MIFYSQRKTFSFHSTFLMVFGIFETKFCDSTFSFHKPGKYSLETPDLKGDSIRNTFGTRSRSSVKRF